MTQTNTPNDLLRLAPDSGLQFLTFGLDLQGSRPFSRAFIGHKFVDQARSDGTIPMQLRPGWNEDDPDGDPPFSAIGDDDEYVINKDKAVETFLDSWIPVPFLAVRLGLDVRGQEILQAGPINWTRVRVSAAAVPPDSVPGSNGPNQVATTTHHVVFTFDTEILESKSKQPYVGPNPEDVHNEREFAFAHRFSDISRFLSNSHEDGSSAQHAGILSWIDRWLLDIYVEARERQLGRRLKDEDKQTVEHLARYVTFLEFLSRAVKIPRIRLIDTYSEHRVTPVKVDLVLDIGNSRTCGILIEHYPNDRQVKFDNTLVLNLRDLSQPHRVYREPFESHVELAQANFGPDWLSKQSTRVRAFFWPSPVRIGPEAAACRDRAQGSEAASGMSSPKRYLCDVAPRNQDWRFQSNDYDKDGNFPTIDLATRQFLNASGDVLRQVEAEPKLYGPLAAGAGYGSELSNIAMRLTYSRSSMFTFMLVEVIAQTISMINNPQVRAFRPDSELPRTLDRIIFSLPTAMPIQEQRIMRSRALAAVKLVWDLMKWTGATPSNTQMPQIPEVRVAWDEATCTQMVYLYNEIVEKFAGNVEEFLELVGCERPFVDADAERGSQPASSRRSIRIASVDVGGGTTDLMVTTYHVEGGRMLVPVQNFREGFRIAGDEVLREVIQQVVLPPLERQLRNAGVGSSREFMNDRFGGNKANQAVQEQHLRRQFVLRVLQPAALAVLRAAETVDPETEGRIAVRSLRELIGGRQDGPNVVSDRIRNYVEREAMAWGASASFALETCEIPMDLARVRSAVAAALSDVFDNIAEAVNHFDCDIVLLSGRPTRLPATIDLFTDKLAVPPDRIVPLSRYQVGKWYPFAGRASFRIEDPKTATAVGCLLCVLVEGQVFNFTVKTRNFSMRSTAKYIGPLENDGRLKNDRVLFKWRDDPKAAIKEEASVAYYAPLRLGYRQLPVERWIATPLYRLIGRTSSQQIQLPLSVVLGRKPPDDSIGMENPQFAANEALKEELVILDVFNRDGGGAGLKKLFRLSLDTLSSEDGYWLDTGILTVTGS